MQMMRRIFSGISLSEPQTSAGGKNKFPADKITERKGEKK